MVSASKWIEDDVTYRLQILNEDPFLHSYIGLERILRRVIRI